ncbi:MAG: hypothetical protein ACI89J_002263 [Hyphomicrobiaceae bacterium]
MRDCLWQKWVSVMELPVNRRTRSTLPDEKAPVDQARIALRRGSPIDCAIMFWQGTSGHAYVHSIYTLAGCPEIPPACVLLVHRPEYGGPRAVLKVMRVEKEAPSLNLAEIRQHGARLGANEVHLHFAAGDRLARSTATFDLATRHGGINIVGK